MTATSGELAKLTARALRAEAALAVQREITNVYVAAWHELTESMQPNTPRVQFAIEMQGRVKTHLAAIKKREVPDDEECW